MATLGLSQASPEARAVIDQLAVFDSFPGVTLKRLWSTLKAGVPNIRTEAQASALLATATLGVQNLRGHLTMQHWSATDRQALERALAMVDPDSERYADKIFGIDKKIALYAAGGFAALLVFMLATKRRRA